jgi:signal transduction histidine kinase
VQESLTNAVKHGSPDSAVLVDIRGHDDQLEIHVRSAGASGASGTTGHGLQGMRERVLLLGGQFAAGPDNAGGFLVQATIPLRATT